MTRTGFTERRGKLSNPMVDWYQERSVMLNRVTLDQAVDMALQLPPEQQDMLVDILRKRRTEARRQEIAADARKSMAAFRKGKLKAQSAEEVIADLHQSLEDNQ